MSRAQATGRLAAIPVAAFVVVLAVTYAYFEWRDVEKPGDAGRRAGEVAPAGGNGEIPAATGKERIVISVRGDGENEASLYTVAVDGSDVVRLTSPPSNSAGAEDLQASPSPDGTRVAFMRSLASPEGEHVPPKIYAVGSDGSTLRRLTRGDYFDFLPAWSPDGSRIAFARLAADATDIFTMRPDGTDVTRLTDEAAHEDMPAWSPDAMTIAFTRVGDDEDLWRMGADGSGQHLLLGGPTQDGSPAWSPDGSRIAFVRDGHIAVMDADGAAIRVLTQNRLNDSRPQWSADGSRILFTREPGHVLLMNADGSRLERVPLEGDAFDAAWLGTL